MLSGKNSVSLEGMYIVSGSNPNLKGVGLLGLSTFGVISS